MGRYLRAFALTGAIVLLPAANAFAAGKALNIATPYESGAPSIAVNGSGTALIAWANTRDLNGPTNFVQYCVLPAGAGACAQSGNLTPADGAQYVDGVAALSDGATFVILADVYGTQGSAAQHYIPEQEWQSTDGGASWAIQAGGLSVSSGIVNADTGPVGAVTLPGSDELGYTWVTAAGPPTFNAFPLSSPPECSVGNGCGFATLEPASNPDQIGNLGGAIGAEQSPAPGVLGVYEDLDSNGPLACSQGGGLAYVYGSGDQSASNSYGVSPGSAGSAWKAPVQQGDCDVEAPAVAGGPSGLGVLESNLAKGTTVYHAFDPSTDSFSAPMVTIAAKGELQPALSQDGSGGIYATYLLGGAGGPIALSYSADGGQSWTTATLNPNTDQRASSTSSDVGSGGGGWAAWLDNGSVFAQSFTAADALKPPAVSSGATTDGKSVSMHVTCVSYPCTVSVTLTAPETATIHATIVRKKGKKKTKIVKIAGGRFTIKGANATKLSVKLSGAGRRFLSSRKGRVKVTATVTEKFGSKAATTTRSVNLTVRKAKRAKK